MQTTGDSDSLWKCILFALCIVFVERTICRGSFFFFLSSYFIRQYFSMCKQHCSGCHIWMNTIGNYMLHSWSRIVDWEWDREKEKRNEQTFVCSRYFTVLNCRMADSITVVTIENNNNNTNNNHIFFTFEYSRKDFWNGKPQWCVVRRVCFHLKMKTNKQGRKKKKERENIFSNEDTTPIYTLTHIHRTPCAR